MRRDRVVFDPTDGSVLAIVPPRRQWRKRKAILRRQVTSRRRRMKGDGNDR